MVKDNLQLQRFELKYLIREETALSVREFISAYLEIDEFGATQPNLSYPIHSLYLDSNELSFYWHTINGNKNRFKLRLRFYDDALSSPVYFEIKRRMNDAIMKQRGAVRRECVDWLMAGHLPDRSHLISPEPKNLGALQRFCQLMNEHQAKPKAHVAYLREAWISPHNNAVRVTMDRNVRFEPDETARLNTNLTNPVVVFGKNVILELKFTGRFPDWFRELVRIFGLAQCSAAKYADGVALVGERRFNGGLIPPSPAALEKLKARRDFLFRNGAECLNVSFA
jgi:hypothetical protein